MDRSSVRMCGCRRAWRRAMCDAGRPNSRMTPSLKVRVEEDALRKATIGSQAVGRSYDAWVLALAIILQYEQTSAVVGWLQDAQGWRTARSFSVMVVAVGCFLLCFSRKPQ